MKISSPAFYLCKLTQTVQQLQDYSSAMNDVKKGLLSLPIRILNTENRSYYLLSFSQTVMSFQD